MKLSHISPALVGLFVLACGSSNSSSPGGENGAGGQSEVGGSATTHTGGSAANTVGTAATGGAAATGGVTSASTGGSSVGPSPTGGSNAATGGKATGGSSPAATGGRATGGAAAGGSNAGGSATGGKSTAAGGGEPTGGKSSGAGGSSPGGSNTGGLNAGGQTAGGKTSTGGSSSATAGQGNGGTSTAGGAGGTGPVLSSGCGKPPSSLTSSQYNNGNPIAITVNGSQRRYILSVPTNYDNTKPYKFVLGIHALDSNDKTVYSWGYYGLQSLSNSTVIFAAPNGVKNNSPCTGTGVGESGCGWPPGNNNMELMDAVVKQVTENFCVDMSHIFATGWSYGASMSYEVGCERPLGGTKANWGVRAIAIYSVRQMSGSCKPTIPIGYYLSHGTNDNVLGYDGGVDLTKTFATTNGCTWATPPKASGSHICTNISGCKAGNATEFCSFVGGHTPFPDSGNQSNSWGPAEVWRFLSQF